MQQFYYEKSRNTVYQYTFQSWYHYQAKPLRRYMKERKIINGICLFLTKCCHTVIDNSIL
jgi:hypothetical protein